jgi:hypothetical protein
METKLAKKLLLTRKIRGISAKILRRSVSVEVIANLNESATDRRYRSLACFQNRKQNGRSAPVPGRSNNQTAKSPSIAGECCLEVNCCGRGRPHSTFWKRTLILKL